MHIGEPTGAGAGPRRWPSLILDVARSGRGGLVIRGDVHNGDITGITVITVITVITRQAVLDDNVVVAGRIMIGRLGEKVNSIRWFR